MVEPNQIEKLEKLCEFSRYLGRLYEREEFRTWLIYEGAFGRKYPLIELYKDLKREIHNVSQINDIKRAFRRFKQRHFLRLGSRDFLGDITFEELTSQISNIAEVCLQTGLEFLKKDFLTPPEIQNCSFLVLGLGKLGGRELNYCSDIDIIYIYRPKNRPSLCSTYTFIARKLNDIIGDMFEGDRVFIVDMRLRPGGRYGELVHSYDSAVEYYLLSGAAWERQALLKARGVAGDRDIANMFLSDVRPFVFRRFLDFQAIDEIRTIRDKIIEETEQKKEEFPSNVKLGIGGIREVEFLVQAFQLIYGGRYTQLREPNTLSCLDKLYKLKLIPENIKEELRSGYIFLRRVEHWIQLDTNKQSSTIPSSHRDIDRLSKSLGFLSVDEFFNTLKLHSRNIHNHFKELFSPTAQGKTPRGSVKEENSTVYIKYGEKEDHIFIGYFSHDVQQGIKNILEGLNQTLCPEFFYESAKRIGTFLSRIEKRPGLVRFLEYHKKEFLEILTIIGSSKFIFHILNLQPSLVEGAIEFFSRSLNNEWYGHAKEILAPLKLEEAIEWLRKLKNEKIIHLAVLDLKGEIEIYELLNRLSDLAEFVIENSYKKVLEYLDIPLDMPLAILAIGKLGSKELGYLSDLDLMYVYEPLDSEDPNIIPQRVINVVQRLNNVLKMPLQEGPGYEIDTRLRPTGNYGPLIVTFKRWLEYYREEADIWELQSLLKLRPIAGNSKLCTKIEELKYSLCIRDVDKRYVWEKIFHMRDRIVNERAQEDSDRLDIKVGRGGLIDLEFFIQGMILSGEIPISQISFGNSTSLLEDSLKIIGKDRESITIFCEIHKNWLMLIQRIHLLTNISSSIIFKKLFLEAIQYGLWPPKGGVFIEDFEDIKKYKKMVDKFWDESKKVLIRNYGR